VRGFFFLRLLKENFSTHSARSKNNMFVCSRVFVFRLVLSVVEGFVLFRVLLQLPILTLRMSPFYDLLIANQRTVFHA